MLIKRLWLKQEFTNRGGKLFPAARKGCCTVRKESLLVQIQKRPAIKQRLALARANRLKQRVSHHLQVERPRTTDLDHPARSAFGNLSLRCLNQEA